MPRTEQQNLLVKDERRDRILNAALKCFAERGLHASTISRIARQARMSQGLLYHYFPSKDAIYTELIGTAFNGMAEAARTLEALPLTPRRKIEKAIVELCAAIAEKEGFATYFMLTAQASFASALPPKAASIIRRKREEPYAVMTRIFRAGQAEGSVRSGDPRELATVFWTMIKGLAMQRAAFGRAYHAPDPDLYLSFFLKENPS